MLQLKNICKTYDTGNFQQVALDNVSIDFRDSEFVAILGPSGSGKTTMLNIVGGLDHYDSGDLIIEGTSTKRYKSRDWDAYRNNRIGFVFQSYNLIPHQTVLANVELALTLSGVEREERHRRAVEALEQVGLGEHIHKKPSQLSGGQMQRVAIARALINNPDILLADEPTGALDSKTSVQIMDLLTQIAADRLVIMVTHNPDLAQEYATRIVELHDGVVVSDTDPFDPSTEPAPVPRPVRRTSMSFFTALALSFNNLMTKKGRTIMTAFAGSIGIIGIAAILALANGVNNYIANVEEETLSEYPLQITSTGFDMTSLLGASADSEDDDADGADSSPTTDAAAALGASPAANGTVRVTQLVTSMFNSVGTNDLESLKTYLESGASDIDRYTNAIEYKYDVTPQVFLSDTSTKVRQVNPDSSLSALGLGSSKSSSSVMSSMYSTDVFYELPSETSLYEGQYDMVAGHWPENANECVLVTTKSGSISDFMLYALGLRDSQELKDMITQFMNDEEVVTPTDIRDYSYDELLNITFKVVNSCDYYEYDATYGVWKNTSEDEDRLRELVNAGEELKIVGIAQPKEGQKVTMLDAGINYSPALTRKLIEKASESQIVKDQLADDKTDVITGKSFTELAEETSSSFDMDSLFTINESALASAFKMDTSALAIDTAQLTAAVQNMQMPSFPSPTEDELGFEASAASVAGITQATYYLMCLYGSTPGAPSFGTQEFSTGFAAWVAADTPVVVPDLTAAAGTTDATGTTGGTGGTGGTGTTTTTMGAQTYLQAIMAVTAGMDYMADFSAYLTRAVTEYTTALIAATMQVTATNVAQQMGAGMANAISVDTSAFSNAFTFNLQGDDLTQVISSMMNTEERTYANNLRDFGYADFDKPSEIDLYPKDFESKEKVTGILDDYNDLCEAAGQEDRVISYTDIVGTLMSSVTTIVNMISTMLIAFVAISLIVSSIMIGVITYISVLERRKEIGILRSIGASRGDIGRVFNAETIIEGFIAGLLGVGITALLCIPANIIIEMRFNVQNIALLPPAAGVALIAISVLLTFIAGLLPSSSASRQDPVEALRSE